MNLQDIYRLAVCFAAISGALNYDTVIKLLSIYLKFLISNRLVVLINISYRDTEQTAFSAAFDYDMVFNLLSTLRLFSLLAPLSKNLLRSAFPPTEPNNLKLSLQTALLSSYCPAFLFETLDKPFSAQPSIMTWFLNSRQP